MFNVTFSGGSSFSAAFSGSESFSADLTNVIERTVTDYYTGSYEFTPSDSEQTISIGGLLGLRDITIHAVPNTYGKVAWNGSYLTVS